MKNTLQQISAITDIATPNGITSINLLKVGDEVLTSKGISTIEEITTTIDNAVNINDVKFRLVAKIGLNTVFNASGDTYNSIKNKTKKYIIDKVNFLKFKSQPITIDPYFLGLWLADGHSDSPCITSHNKDLETQKFIYQYATSLDCKVNESYSSTNSTYFRIVGMSNLLNHVLKQLQALNLINNKHVPLNYIYNSYDVRMRILAGMIDGDGGLESNHFVLTLKNRDLIESFAEIAKSLGFNTTLSVVKKRCTNSPTKAVGTYHTLIISGHNLHLVPVLLPRKQPVQKDHAKDTSRVTTTFGKIEKSLLYSIKTANNSTIITSNLIKL